MKNCFCVKNVWFDDNKCWSLGKFQWSQSNVSRIFEEYSTNFCFKNIPRISSEYYKVMRNVGDPVKVLISAGSLPYWNVFLNFVETVFHLE